jgi:hypothetical protein
MQGRHRQAAWLTLSSLGGGLLAVTVGLGLGSGR